EPPCQLDHTWVAGEHVRWDVEVRLAHRIDLSDTRCRGQLNSIDRTRYVLRVIERVVEIRAQLDLLASLAGREVFEDGEIEVLDRRQLKRVPTGIRQRTKSRLDVLRVRIVSHVSHDSLRIRNCAGTVFIEGGARTQ